MLDRERVVLFRLREDIGPVGFEAIDGDELEVLEGLLCEIVCDAKEGIAVVSVEIVLPNGVEHDGDSRHRVKATIFNLHF